MKTAAFVPIKFNNTRLKNKNILPFGEKGKEKPLLTFIFDILLKVRNLDSIYCYCSDEKVLRYLPDGIKFLKGDKYLDGDSVTSNELLYYFAQDVEADCYLLTHATNPLIKPDTIERVIAAVSENGCDSAMTVRKIQDLVWIAGRPNFDPADAPLTQNIEPIYQETYGALCLRRNIIVNERRRAGYNPAFIEVSAFEAVDINTYEDFEFARALYSYVNRESV